MALPVNVAPVYTITIPSTKKEFKFRPFLVRDEKALLIAQESEDPVVMVDTIKEVIKSCAKSPIDVDKLASFDIEYIFINLRSKSVGELVELIFRCDDCTDEKARVNKLINLSDIKVNFPEGHTNKIPLFDDVGIVMKYPNLSIIKKLEELNNPEIDLVFDIIVECIDYIYSGDEVFPAKEQKKAEMIDFLNNLTSSQFATIQSFFDTMPRLLAQVEYTCPVCSKQHNKYLEGLSSFF